MATYLDKAGLAYLWGKIKAKIDSKFADATKVATTTSPGWMSASDKVKLNGVETGAQVNTVASVNGIVGDVVINNVDSAVKLKTARTIGVSGGASGTPTSFDGSANISIPITSFATNYLSEPAQSSNGINSPTLRTLYDTTRANRLMFLPADQIIIEKTTDGGASWVDAEIGNSTKVALFSETRPSISIPLLNGIKDIKCGLRITITGMKYNVPAGTAETNKYNYWNSNYILSAERYCQIKDMYFWVSSNSDAMKVTVQRATGAAPTTWNTIFSNDSFGINGWSGNDYIKFSQGTFGGGTTQTANFWNYRIILMTCGSGGSSTLSTVYTTMAQEIHEIRAYGDTWWTSGNSFMANDHLYTWDADKNALFPASITATNLTGLASKATSDSSGNNILTTYASSLEASGKTLSLKSKSGTILSTVNTQDTTYTNATSSAAGLMSSTDKTNLDGVIEQLDDIAQILATI